MAMKLFGKKKISINYSKIFIILLILVLIVEGYFSYNNYSIAKELTNKVSRLESEKNSLQSQINFLNSQIQTKTSEISNLKLEIEQKKKEGKSEMTAALEVMRVHQGEMRKMLGQ